MSCQIGTILRFTLKLLNHQTVIQIGKRGSRSFTSFTPLPVPLRQMLHLASLPVRGLGGCGTVDSQISAENCSVKIAVQE
jgi:hypothetical protein